MTRNDFPIIFDGHNDTLLNIYLPNRGGGRSFFVSSKKGHIDLPRARQGGFGGGFFAIFVPADKPELDDSEADTNDVKVDYELEQEPMVDFVRAQQVTEELMALLFEIERESAGQFKVVRTADDLVACLSDGTIAAILHFEGAETIDKGLENLPGYYERGLRSLGLTWSRPNAFGFGVPFRFPESPDTGPGLTDAGKALVRECNRLGILVDLSHLNEKGFWDVAKLSEAPLVATHSGAHQLCRSTRNLTDKQLDAIGESGGLVGINFHVGFLRQDGRQDADTPVSEIVRHVDYVAGRIGVEHVALGSDFDGATMPKELGDVSGLPKLVTALRDSGHDDATLRKMAHENWLRVLEQTWRH